jgi:hypothetical protein
MMRRFLVPVVTLQAFLLSAITAFAQDTKDVNVDINLKGNGAGGWYTMWWVWVIIAVFIIVIVALTTRGGSSRQD